MNLYCCTFQNWESVLPREAPRRQRHLRSGRARLSRQRALRVRRVVEGLREVGREIAHRDAHEAARHLPLLAELREDREQSPFNSRDFSATDLYLPSLHYRFLMEGGFSLASRLSFRDTAEDGFNGGRSGLGSISAVDRMGLSWTVQAPGNPAQTVTANDLLARTVLYKVGHHGSHNATLAEKGFFPKEELIKFRSADSYLEGHPNMRRLNGVEASTGSLGHGLGMGYCI